MALKLVNQLTEKFHPEKYHDDYTDELLHLIELKVKGKVPRKKGAPVKKSSKIVDISTLLEQSLKETKQSSKRLPPQKKLRKAQ